MTLEQFLFAISIACVVGAGLLGIRLISKFRHVRAAQIYTLICVNSIAHVVLSRNQYEYWLPDPFKFDVGGWEPLLNLARNSSAGLFMILCHVLFMEGRRFPRVLLALFLLQMMLEEPGQWLLSSNQGFERLVTEMIPSFLQTVFIGIAIYWTISNWRVDLVENRRRSRALVLILIGVQMIASSLLLRVLIDPNTVANYYTHEALVFANFILLATLLVFFADIELVADLVNADARTPDQTVIASISDPQSHASLQRLNTLLEDEHIYREPDLSMNGLAVKVGLPEYRLRKLIHEQLGHRNFNAFLHAYRVADACKRFRDRSQDRTPILTIALSVGYQSINTFNRGFREVMGITPSEYRAAQVNTAETSENPSPKIE